MRITFWLLVLCIPGKVFAQSYSDELIGIVESELNRELAGFKSAGEPPYYLGYRIYDLQVAVLTSSFGSLVRNDHNRSRSVTTDIRVGDYSFDNSHPVEDYESIGFFPGGFGGLTEELPLENDPKVIPFILWKQTQQAYRMAVASFKEIRNMPKRETKRIPDFSREAPTVFVQEPLPDFNTFYNCEEWTARIKNFSKPFLEHPEIVDAEANLMVGLERKYLVSSEGTRIAQNRTYAYLTIHATIRAEDGDVLPLHQSYFAFTPAELPGEQTILKDVHTMMQLLSALRTAPIAEPYTGPAILHARSAGVFFHEIFGHRVEGHRLKQKFDAQTFRGKLMDPVLPKTMNVVFDPTLETFNGQALNGHYHYDDEGVRGQRVNVVEKGILKSFLMSRTPIEGHLNSNGHGRADVGEDPVSRQSNLVVETQKAYGMNDLRKMLIAECQKQKKKYGYLFMDVVGGFTTTDRFMPNAFNIFPTRVYRVYVDGRPDELVRGVDLIGTPLAMFAGIVAAGDTPEVFTGFCGAESGSIPVTAISPSIFVKRIETQKKPVMQLDPSILTRPDKP